MQAEKTEFENCDPDTIYRNISKNTQTNETDSRICIKSKKLPLPRHLEIGKGFRDGKKINSYNNEVKRNTRATKQQNKKCETCKRPKIPWESVIHSLISKQDDTYPIPKDSPQKPKYLHTEVTTLDKTQENNNQQHSNKNVSQQYIGDNKSISSFKKSKYMNDIINSNKPIPLYSCSYSSSLNECHDICADKKDGDRTSRRKSSHKKLNRKRSSNKSLKKHKSSCKGICNKRSDEYLKRECEKYLERKCSKKHSKYRSHHRKRSSHRDVSKKKSRCKGICKEKYLRKECEKYLERKLSKHCLGDKKSNSYSSQRHGSRKRSNKDLSKRKSSHKSLKKKKSTCKGICNEKYLKKECEKSVRKKHSRQSSHLGWTSQSESSIRKRSHKSLHKKKSGSKSLKKKHHSRTRSKSKSCSSICPSNKSSHKTIYERKSSSKRLEKECAKYLERKCSREKSSHKKYSSHKRLSKKRSSCKGICKEKYLKTECEKFLDKKLSKHHLGDGKSHSHSSISGYSSGKKRSHKKKSFCKGLCKDKDNYLKKERRKHKRHKHTRGHSSDRSSSYSTIGSRRKSPHRHRHRGNSCDDICNPEVNATCQAKKSCHRARKRKSHDSYCKKCCKDKKIRSHKDKKHSSRQSSLCIILQEPKKEIPPEGKPTDESKPGESKPGDSKPGKSRPGKCKPGEGTTGDGKPDEGKSGEGKPDPGNSAAESGDTKSPSRLCLYVCPCKKDKIHITQGACLVNNSKKSSQDTHHFVKKVSSNSGNKEKVGPVSVQNISSKKLDKIENKSWDGPLTKPLRNNSSNKISKNSGMKRKSSSSVLTDLEISSFGTFTNDSRSESDSNTYSNSTNGSINSYSMSDGSSIYSKDDYTTRSSENSDNTLLCAHSEISNQEYEKQHGRPVPKCISGNYSDEDKTPKTLLDAHCRTMCTIKGAMQDLICKVYNDTSEAVSCAATIIQTESAKQMESIRNFRCDEDDNDVEDSKIKKCNAKNAGGTLKKLVHEIKSNNINAKDVYSAEPSKQNKLYDENKKNCNSSVISNKIKTYSFNDNISIGYDRNLLQERNLSNNTTSTSTNNMFSSLKTKAMSIFSDKDEDSCVKALSSGSSTSISKVTINYEESSNKDERSKFESWTSGTIKTFGKMDSKPTTRSYTNPNIKNTPTRSEINISNSKKELSTSDLPSQKSLGSMKISIDTFNQIVSRDSNDQFISKSIENNKRTLVIERKDRINLDNDLVKGRPVPTNVSRCCPCNRVKRAGTETTRPKSIVDAHSETMATIKCAMHDVICKAYSAASEAVSVIKTESVKQLENLKKITSDDKCLCDDRPKKCSNENSKTTLTNLIHGVTNVQSKEECSEASVPYQLYNQISEKVCSMISLARGLPFESILPSSYNDNSSDYDVPDPNLHQKKNKPEQVSNLIRNDTKPPSRKSLFTSIKTKILSIFAAEENGDRTPSSIASSITISEISLSKEESGEDLTKK